MSFVINPSSSEEIQSFLKNLICPVDKTPLVDAVALKPCDHLIREVVAIKLYWIAEREGKVQLEGPCPVCKKRVTGYLPSLHIRAMASNAKVIQLLNDCHSAPEQEKEKVKAADRKEAVAGSIAPKKYQFYRHPKTDWSEHVEDNRGVRKVVFECPMTRVKVELRANFFNQVFLRVDFPGDPSKVISEFLTKHKYAADLLEAQVYHGFWWVSSSTRQGFKALSEYLFENFSFPESWGTFLQKIVEKGHCEGVVAPQEK